MSDAAGAPAEQGSAKKPRLAGEPGEGEAAGVPSPGRPQRAPPDFRTSTGALEGAAQSSHEDLGALDPSPRSSPNREPRPGQHQTVRLSDFRNSALNLTYVERRDADTVVNGRATFLAESGALFIYWNEEHRCWTVAAAEDLQAVKAGVSKALAASPKDWDILDAAMPLGWIEREKGKAVKGRAGVAERGAVARCDAGLAPSPRKGAVSSGGPLEPLPRRYRVTAKSKVGILPKPDVEALPGTYIQTGEEFEVSGDHRDPGTGRRYVRLSDGRGWVPEHSRKDPSKAVIVEIQS